MKAVVVGSGGWGTALSMVLCDNGHDVTLWGPFRENIEAIRATGVNQFLKGVTLPEELRAPAELVRSRLAVCKSCDCLLSGMCVKCGCFVEARAAKAVQHCPFTPSKW